MKYEKDILEGYARVGYKPQGNQVEYINEIIEAYRDEGCTNVVLSAPTGTGKSVIGVVVAEVLHKLENHPDHQASFLLTATNALSKQYFDSFADKHADSFLMIKGAANYECEAMTTPQEVQTAETCSFTLLKKQELFDVIDRFCNRCEYRDMRNRRDSAKHVITNYAYYFVDRMYSPKPMLPRTVTVYDEAHLLNDLFTEHLGVGTSDKALEKMAQELTDNLELGASTIFKDIKDLRTILSSGNMDESNYGDFLKELKRVKGEIKFAAELEAAKNLRNQKVYAKLMKMAKKYGSDVTKIDDLFLYEYPRVFEYKKKDVAKGQPDHEMSVRPIFIGDMFAAMENSTYNLLMSGTINHALVDETITLPGKTKYIRLPPQFDPANKRVVFYKTMSLNFNTMKDPNTIATLCKTTREIVDHHSQKNERGILLAPSFKVAEEVAKAVRQNRSVKVFEHVRGSKLAELVEEFKRYSLDKPAVIITPSGYEGIDLPGDFSRYQILLKHPFANLADKRIKTILDSYPNIYATTSLQKIVQGAGRSVRGHDDWAITYCLDNATKRAWGQKNLNEWHNEFTTSYTSQLDSDD